MSIHVMSTLLANTDQSASVIRLQTASGIRAVAYCPFGYHPAQSAGFAAGFNGQLREPELQGYLLGNGNRLFNPVVRRFNNPDSLSPFRAGGLNACMYCGGDPVNHADPVGIPPQE